jgi:hypothetical protein
VASAVFFMGDILGGGAMHTDERSRARAWAAATMSAKIHLSAVLVGLPLTGLTEAAAATSVSPRGAAHCSAN